MLCWHHARLQHTSSRCPSHVVVDLRGAAARATNGAPTLRQRRSVGARLVSGPQRQTRRRPHAADHGRKRWSRQLSFTTGRSSVPRYQSRPIVIPAGCSATLGPCAYSGCDFPTAVAPSKPSSATPTDVEQRVGRRFPTNGIRRLKPASQRARAVPTPSSLSNRGLGHGSRERHQRHLIHQDRASCR